MKPEDIPQNLLESAVFGRQVENFLSSDLGRYLVKRSEAEASEAMEKLKVVLPWRRRRITELQNDIKVAEWFQQWLADAILDGIHATNQIDEE